MTNSIGHLAPNCSALAAPCVPLTDAQYEDYTALVAEAEALYAIGRLEDAKRITRLAWGIVRSGAPARE